MAQQVQPAYVERWDSHDFPELPYRQARDGLRFWRERVVATGDGEVLRGQLTVANAIAEAWCKDNPTLFEALIEEWTEQARAEGEADINRRRDEARSIADHPALAEALEHDAHAVFRQAALNDHQIRVLELRFDRQKSLAEIGVAFGVSRERARQYVEQAIDKILALDAE